MPTIPTIPTIQGASAAPTGPGLHPPAPVVVDASVWAGFFLTADPSHPASYAWLDRHTVAGGLVVSPAILLIEVAAAISRRLGLTGGAAAGLKAATTISRLAEARIVPMNASLVGAATDIAANLGLRGADSFYVAAARQLGIPLLTWDKEQLTRTATVITVFHP